MEYRFPLYIRCESCGCYHGYGITWRTQKYLHRGSERVYREYHARCLECGHKVYMPELDIVNMRSKRNGYIGDA